MNNLNLLSASLICSVMLFSCDDSDPVSPNPDPDPVNPDTPSTVDPLPMPAWMEENKDLSVKPGDSFFDYCNGTWLKNTPIPATGTVGGMYRQIQAMEERIEELKKKYPDVGHFYALQDAASGNPEATKIFMDELRAKYPTPKTKEEAYLTIGKMLADGFPMWGGGFMPVYNMLWKDGKMTATLFPYISDIPDIPDLPDIPTGAPYLKLNPADFHPLGNTRSGEGNSALSLVIKGMGKELSYFVISSDFEQIWKKMDDMSLDELCKLIDEYLNYYDQFGAETLTDKIRQESRLSFNYPLSYYFIQGYVPSSLKEKYVGITKEIQASLRNRIQNVDWMSETTKNHALEKLDACGLYIAYPDQWYEDCLPDYEKCKTLAEAVYLSNKCNAGVKDHVHGTKDAFSSIMLMSSPSSKGFIPNDLTLVNAFYAASYNGIFIYPAFMLPPIIPENVSNAYIYAIYMVIGHEFTHGFDDDGAKYDKNGNQKNWWTVADMMAFEERRDMLANIHNHMEIDPVRAPGKYNDGKNTSQENIADLGGVLAALDAYKARLEKEGYYGDEMDKQLRKFFESYADLWCNQYSDARFADFPKNDTHSHARLRINGVVMNSDVWYDLYDVDRNNILYLPPERRAKIW